MGYFFLKLYTFCSKITEFVWKYPPAVPTGAKNCEFWPQNQFFALKTTFFFRISGEGLARSACCSLRHWRVWSLKRPIKWIFYLVPWIDSIKCIFLFFLLGSPVENGFLYNALPEIGTGTAVLLLPFATAKVLIFAWAITPHFIFIHLLFRVKRR